MNRPVTVDLVRELSDQYGGERVVIRTEYHIQAFPKPNVCHNIWINAPGEFKWRLFGQRQVTSGGKNKLLAEIRNYDRQKTDLGEMQQATELSRKILAAGRDAIAAGVTYAVFCDAGVKGDKARISVVAILGDRVEAFSEPVVANNSHEAEIHAIEAALEHYPDETLPIFNDAQGAVQKVDRTRVRWISRDQNTSADRIANLRGGG